MRSLTLDPDSLADQASFTSLTAVAGIFGELTPGSWLLIGGWMVKAWSSQGQSDVEIRATSDVDIALLASRTTDALGVVEALLQREYAQMTTPFRFESDSGAAIDILVPPGASRHHPPRIGALETLEAPGTRLAFELPLETFRFIFRDESVGLPVASLAGALVAKTVLLAKQRQRRVRDDAHDVAALLACLERIPEPSIGQLRKHRKRSDVRAAQRALEHLFAAADSVGTSWVAAELGLRSGLEAASRARWLLDSLADQG